MPKKELYVERREEGDYATPSGGPVQREPATSATRKLRLAHP